MSLFNENQKKRVPYDVQDIIVSPTSDEDFKLLLNRIDKVILKLRAATHPREIENLTMMIMTLKSTYINLQIHKDMVKNEPVQNTILWKQTGDSFNVRKIKELEAAIDEMQKEQDGS